MRLFDELWDKAWVAADAIETPWDILEDPEEREAFEAHLQAQLDMSSDLEYVIEELLASTDIDDHVKCFAVTNLMHELGKVYVQEIYADRYFKIRGVLTS